MRIGYLKPLGSNPTRSDGIVVDGDALFLARALHLAEPLEQLSPVVVEETNFDWPLELVGADLVERVREAHRGLAAGKDLLIVGGAGGLFQGHAVGLDGASVAAMLDASVLLVLSHQDRSGIDLALAARDLLGERLLGVIVNRVPPAHVERLGERLTPFLAERGLTLFGLLPADHLLAAVSVAEIAEHLGGEILVGREHLDAMVERLVVGAMNLDSALKILRAARNKAVITGGDRADIQLASLETSTRCLILTGGLYPNEIILAKAREAGVPVLLVRADTLTTVERLDEIMGVIHPHEQAKLDRACELIGRGVAVDKLFAALGLAGR